MSATPSTVDAIKNVTTYQGPIAAVVTRDTDYSQTDERV